MTMIANTLLLILGIVCSSWAAVNAARDDEVKNFEELSTELAALTTGELVDIICSCRDNENNEAQPTDCYDIFENGKRASGQYKIYPYNAEITDVPVHVWCDMDAEEGGWTVIQRRQDGSTDFNLKWIEYRNGFGSLGGEFWLGNEKVYLITNQREYTLRVELEEWNGTHHSFTYEHFRIGDESTLYTLNVVSSAGICDQPLGMEDRRITDDQITASSELSSPWGPAFGRLNVPDRSWHPKTYPDQWIRVTFNSPTLVSGIVTQGRPTYDQWVKTYNVQRKEGSNEWQYVHNEKHQQLFSGNRDRSTPVTNFFSSTIKASSVQILPVSYQSVPCLRFELLGCEGDLLIFAHNYQPFSTKDSDKNTESDSNCAISRGPWWYGTCDQSSLNGEYLKGVTTKSKGIVWKNFVGDTYNIKRTEMKIRPIA